MTDSEIAAALRILVDVVADAVERRLSDGCGQWVDQQSSPLGARRHCAAVRRRVADGSGGAAVIGRRHLLTPDALAMELAAPSKNAQRRATTKRDNAPDDFEASLRRKLRLVGGSL